MILIPLLLVIMTSLSAPAPLAAEAASNALSAQNPETVGAYVRQYYADTPILADIAWCESRNRQWDAKGKVFRGAVNRYDVGAMQINVLYHEDEAKTLGLDLNTLSGNLAYARRLYDREGTRPWASSEDCWGKIAGR